MNRPYRIRPYRSIGGFLLIHLDFFGVLVSHDRCRHGSCLRTSEIEGDMNNFREDGEFGDGATMVTKSNDQLASLSRIRNALSRAEAFAAEYEFDSDEGCHTPNDLERMLMLDMLNGLFDDEAFITTLTGQQRIASVVTPEMVEAVAKLISPWAFDVPELLNEKAFIGAGPWPEGQFYVWDKKRAQIVSPNHPDYLAPWPKFSSIEGANAAAEALNQQPLRPYLNEQFRAKQVARAALTDALSVSHETAPARTVYVAVDHTGCIHSCEDGERIIAIARANEASVKRLAVSHETGDGETPTADREYSDIDDPMLTGLASVATDETQEVKRVPVGYTTQAMLEALQEPDTICGTIWPKAGELATIPLFSLSQLEAVDRDKDQILADFAATAFALETAEASLAAMREALARIAAIKYGKPDTVYAQKAKIDYARNQASRAGENGR